MTKPHPRIVALNKAFQEEIRKYTDRKSPEYNPQKALGVSAKFRAEERRVIKEMKV